MFQRQNNFTNIDSHFVLGEMFSLIEMCKQLSTAHVICKNWKLLSFNELDNTPENTIFDSTESLREIFIFLDLLSSIGEFFEIKRYRERRRD